MPLVPVERAHKAPGPAELVLHAEKGFAASEEDGDCRTPRALLSTSSTTMFNTTLRPSTNLYVNSTSPSGPRGIPPWYQFPVCGASPWAFIFYFGVKVFNLAVGTPCNALVIWQIASRKREASTSDIFIFNLAILDVYFCLMTPVEIVNRLLLNDSRIWYFQRFAYGVKDLAPLFLVCICLDRYTAVVHPVLFTGIRDNKIRIGISAVVWALTLAFGLTSSILGVESVNEVFSAVVMFASAVMVFCNVSVVWVLRRSVAGKEQMHPVKKKALRMVLIILAIVVSNYLPVALMPFVSYYTFVVFHCQIRVSVFSIMDLSSSIEPLVYITKMDRGDGRCCGRCFSEEPHDVQV